MAHFELLILLLALNRRDGSVDKMLACIHEDQSQIPRAHIPAGKNEADPLIASFRRWKPRVPKAN